MFDSLAGGAGVSQGHTAHHSAVLPLPTHQYVPFSGKALLPLLLLTVQSAIAFTALRVLLSINALYQGHIFWYWRDGDRECAANLRETGCYSNR
jgi:hypothetical protein